MVAPTVARMATQRDLDRGLKIGRKALVDVLWLDACAHMNVPRIDRGNLLDLLCETHTFGQVVAQDDQVLVVATNISGANGADIIAIPVRWIDKVKIMDAG